MNKKHDLKKLRFLVDEVVVKHSSFVTALCGIDKCFNGSLYGSDSICCAILGESRSGKSRLLEHYEVSRPRVRHSYGLEVPVLRIKVQSKPTVKGLAEELLHNLGDPLFYRGTENAKTLRLKKLLLTAKTRVLMLDEFQHFVDQGSKKIQHHVSDWLKILVDDLRIGLVVAGLPYSADVIESNIQLARRFLSPIILTRFDWNMASEREEFVDILYSLQDSLKPFDFPKLYSDELSFRMYCATGGLIGYVIKLLREATSQVLDKKKLVVSMSDLACAHKSAFWNKVPGLEKPFSKKFFSSIDRDTVDKVKLLGNHSNEKGVDIAKIKFKNVSEILSTR